MALESESINVSTNEKVIYIPLQTLTEASKNIAQVILILHLETKRMIIVSLLGCTRAYNNIFFLVESHPSLCH